MLREVEILRNETKEIRSFCNVLYRARCLNFDLVSVLFARILAQFQKKTRKFSGDNCGATLEPENNWREASGETYKLRRRERRKKAWEGPTRRMKCSMVIEKLKFG